MRIVYLFMLMFISLSLPAQGFFERKIVVSDSTFYAVEIVDQLAVLWVGKMDQPLDSARRYQLPAGTKRRSQMLLPFAWDYYNDTIYAVNFTEYAQNDRMTSLKSIAMNTLDMYDPSASKKKYFEQAAYLNGNIENFPLVSAIKKYTYMDDLFFDVMKTSSGLYQFISVKNEMTIWRWDEKTWHTTATFSFSAQQFFVGLRTGERIFVISSDGEQYFLKDILVPLGKKIQASETTLFIEDRDTQKIQVIRNSDTVDTHISMRQFIQQNIL